MPNKYKFNSIIPDPLTKYEKLLLTDNSIRTSFRVDVSNLKYWEKITTGRLLSDIFDEMASILSDEKRCHEIFTESTITDLMRSKIKGPQKTVQIKDFAKQQFSISVNELKISRDIIFNVLLHELASKLDQIEITRTYIGSALQEKVLPELDHILNVSLETLTPGDKVLRALLFTCRDLDQTIMNIIESGETGDFQNLHE